MLAAQDCFYCGLCTHAHYIVVQLYIHVHYSLVTASMEFSCIRIIFNNTMAISTINLKISEWLGSISVIRVLETTLADHKWTDGGVKSDVSTPIQGSLISHDHVGVHPIVDTLV